MIGLQDLVQNYLKEFESIWNPSQANNKFSLTRKGLKWATECSFESGHEEGGSRKQTRNVVLVFKKRLDNRKISFLEQGTLEQLQIITIRINILDNSMNVT